jgi:hypothetical protein
MYIKIRIDRRDRFYIRTFSTSLHMNNRQLFDYAFDEELVCRS